MGARSILIQYRRLNIFIKLGLWLLVAFLLYTSFGFWGVPWLVKYVLVNKVPQSIQRQVKVKEVTFNPFKLYLKVDGLEIGSKVKGKKLLNLKGLELDVEAASIPKMAFIVSKLKVDSPSIFLERDKKGHLSIEDLFATEEKETNKEKGNFKFSLNNIEISNGKLIFQDQLKQSVHNIEKINIGIPFISNIDQDVSIYVKPYFSASINGSPVEFKGQTRPFAQDRDTIIDLKFTDVDITRYLNYFPNLMGLKLNQGKLSTNLALHFALKDKPMIALSGNVTIKNAIISKLDTKIITVGQLGIKLKQSRLFSKKIAFDSKVKDLNIYSKSVASNDAKTKPVNSSKPLFTLPMTSIEGVRLELAKGLTEIESVAIKNPSVKFTLFKDGGSNVGKFVEFLTSDSSNISPGKEKKEDSNESNQKKTEGEFRVGKVSIDGASVHFSDLTPENPVSLEFSGLKAIFSDFSTKAGNNFSYNMETAVNKTGKIKISGKGKLANTALESQIQLSNVPLPPFQGYVDKYLNLELGRGHLSLVAKASFDQKDKGKINLKVDGNSKLQNVLIFSKKTQEPFVKWKEIAINKFLFTYAPVKLIIDEISLNRLQQNLIVFKDGTLNISNLLKETKEEKKKEKTKVARKDTSSDSSSDVLIKIKKIKFDSCKLKVVDRSLKQVFVREFASIKGTLTGISNQPDMKGKVNLTALVDNRSKVLITGLVNPLAKPLYVDLSVKIGGAGMTRFSPYAQRFLGYKIEKGKMFLDLKIKLEGKKLYVDNKLVLDQFDLGERVPSKDAINAPIKLAIALLKDRSGKIDLNIPIRGKLDDPKFSYRSAVLKAIMNIFIKAATSPFSLLGAMLGSGEQLDFVAFKPGISKLDENATKKLDILSKALADRPALKVEISGCYDPSLDKKGLEEKRFMHLLKKEKFKDLSNAEREQIEDIDEINIAPDEYEKYLKKAYKNAKFKRPRNFIGMLKKQPKEEMERMIREHITIDESDLKNLANERAKAVANYLIKKGKIEHQRIFVVSPKAITKKDNKSTTCAHLSLK